MRPGHFAFLTVLALVQAPSVAGQGYGLDSWTTEASPTPQWLRDMAYGNGTFVAVGDNGSIFTSPDGKSWAAVPASPADHYASITFADGRFLLTGRRFVNYPTSWDGIILSSTDAVHWTEVFRQPDLVVFDLVWGGGQFVAVAGALVPGSVTHAAQALTSANGEQWAIHELGPGFWPYAIACGNGKFAGVGGTHVFASNDGANWAVASAGPGRNLSAIAFGAGVFVAVGGSGAVGTSANGTDWTPRAAVTSDHLGALTYAAGGFVAGGNKGKVVSSVDGTTWTLRNSLGPDIRGIAFGTDRFITVGRNGTLRSGLVQDLPRLQLRLGNVPEIILWGDVGQAHRVEFSEDPGAADWQVLTVLPTLPSSPYTIMDTEAAGARKRFYRAVLLP